MRKIHGALLFVLALSTVSSALAAGPKEWTFLVFLNGNNNLDRFGAMNINQMEQVGSSDQVNVVVQWASLSAKKVKRIYVTKDNKPTQVTSPVVQDMGTVDMGDWHNLVEFVRWGKQKYPAKHYFITVWNHGSGWHAQSSRGGKSTRGGVNISDISWDDISGNHITTEQLGVALQQSAAILGQKIDIYGSDACLMAMAEVGSEMSDSVRVLVGSEEVEPGAGWPYHWLLRRWTAKPTATAREVSTMLTEEYVRIYREGDEGVAKAEVQFSAFDLEKTAGLHQAVSRLGGELRALPESDRSSALEAASRTQSFEYSDYGDFGDFLKELRGSRIAGISEAALTEAETALHSYVIANATTPNYSKAQGAAVWLPGSKYTYASYSSRYKGLKFSRETGWADTLESLYP